MTLSGLLSPLRRRWDHYHQAGSPFVSSHEVRGAHWFSRHDPVNFWDAFRPEALDDEFRLLREDGFNTLFLLIPWHAFFPEMNSRIDPWYAERLKLILKTAQQHRLRIVGRLFYEHCAARNDEILLRKRQYAVLNQPETIDILAAQARALRNLVRWYPAWAEAFVSWEDFWSCFEGPPTWSADDRRVTARTSGFSHWVDVVVGEDKALVHGLERIDGTWVVPAHGSPGMALWVPFFDNVFRERVMKPCRQAFPDLGAEVRVDAYPIARAESDGGGYDWHYFDLCNDLPGRRYVYWGAYYGQPNEGEQLSAEAAVTGLGYLLDRFPAERPPVVDQLNFQDTTLNFVANNARIAPDQINSFLAQCAERLRSQRAGYAVWASRDYRENWIANPSFQRGGKDWQSGRGQVNLHRGDVLQIAAGETVSQFVIPARCAQAPGELYPKFFISMEFDRSDLDASLRLRVAGQEMAVVQQSADEIVWTVPHDIVAPPVPWNHGFLLEFENAGRAAVDIDTVYFWGFTQTLGLRAHDAAAGPYLSGIHALNERLG